MTIEQMIEEAVNRFEKKFGMYYQPHGDAFNEASAFFSNELRLIATKSAEEERNKIGNLINSTKNDTEKIDLVVKYLNKDTNE